MKKAKPDTAPFKIPILDLSGFTTFQTYHGNTFEFSMNGSRGTAMFEPTPEFYRIAELFNNNAPVNVLDFLNHQRQIKAMLMSRRQQGA